MFLVIETHTPDLKAYYTHFINLNKDDVTEQIYYFMKHLYDNPTQVVDRCYYSKCKLSNW